MGKEGELPLQDIICAHSTIRYKISHRMRTQVTINLAVTDNAMQTPVRDRRDYCIQPVVRLSINFPST